MSPSTTTKRGSRGSARWIAVIAIVLVGLGLVGSIPGLLEDTGTPATSGSTYGIVGGESLEPGAIATETSPGDEVSQEPSAEPTPSPVTLAAAIAAKQVKLSAIGDGLQSMSVSLQSLTDESFDVLIPVGTVLAPKAKGTQTMVVIADEVVTAYPGELGVGSGLDVACASMKRDTPDGKDTFHLVKAPKKDLLKLLRSPAFAAATFRVKQFAIWTITDNPARGRYVGLGFAGAGSGPTKTEYARIKALFKKAGIKATNYAAF